MDLELTDRVALVCAASQGLGRAVATELAREGACVAMCARTPETLEAARNEVAAETGAHILAIPADVSNMDDVERLVTSTRRELGPISILVTNAGGPPPGPFESHDLAAWQTAFELTLRSVVELCRRVVGDMKDAGWGRILNVTSMAVKQPVDNLILSNSLRAGVTGFARTLANELAPHGITVNNLMPGYTKTTRLEKLAEAISQQEGTSVQAVYTRWEREIPARRLGEPAEFAALAAFLCSTRAAYITGASIPVDGGVIRSLV